MLVNYRIVHLSTRDRLSPVDTSNNVEAALSNATRRTIRSTKLNVASTLLLPFLTTMSNEFFVKFHPFDFRQTKSKQTEAFDL